MIDTHNKTPVTAARLILQPLGSGRPGRTPGRTRPDSHLNPNPAGLVAATGKGQAYGRISPPC